MKSKFMVNWAIWIGLIVGIFVVLYSLTPLLSYGVMWSSFVVLAIYFTAGAEAKEFPNYAVSSVLGVAWAVFYLWAIGKLLDAGLNVAAAQGIAVGVICAVQCTIHFIPPLSKTWFNKPTAMFGGIAVTFSQGGQNLVPIAITLCLGCFVCMLCAMGTKLLTEDGKWKFFAVNKTVELENS